MLITLRPLLKMPNHYVLEIDDHPLYLNLVIINPKILSPEFRLSRSSNKVSGLPLVCPHLSQAALLPMGGASTSSYYLGQEN